MSLFQAMQASATGMNAERFRMDLISNNLANANTTRTAAGTPFQRQLAIFAPRAARGGAVEGMRIAASNGARFLQGRVDGERIGVRVIGTTSDTSPFPRRYDPGHPDADDDGYVTLSNVDPIREMVDMMAASRAYEANLSAMGTTRQMLQKTIDLGRY